PPLFPREENRPRRTNKKTRSADRRYGLREAASSGSRSGRPLQRCNPLVEGRMRHEEPGEPARRAAVDAERGHLVRKLRLVARLEPLERRDHLLPPREPRTAGVRAELAVAAEPHDDDARENRQHELGDDRRHPEGRAVAFFVPEYGAVDDVP